MVEVSQAWKDNQNAKVHAQGYIKVSLTDENGTVTLSSLDAASHIKQTVHKRSFDPMGFDLPKNDLTLELYNYGGVYTHYYEDYAGQPIEITVKYGYILEGGAEEIQGGVFEVDTITLGDDDTITFSAVSALEKSDAEVTFDFGVLFNTGGQKTTLWAPTDNSKTSASVSVDAWKPVLDKCMTDMEDVLVATEDASGLTIEKETGLTEKTAIGFVSAQTLTAQETVQDVVSSTNTKCIIGRNGNVSFNGYKCPTKAEISQQNMIDRPTLTRSKQLKKISCTSLSGFTLVDGESPGTADETYTKVVTYEGWGPLTFSLDVPIRYLQIQNSNYNPRRFPLKGIDVEVSNGEYIYTVNYNDASSNTPTQRVKYRVYDYASSELSFDLSNIPYGEVCDIDNPIALPTDTDAIINYFSNRSIYSVSLRGDPARDVGDMVFLEVSKSDFQKALILESELTFDGVFTEDIKARIIETDFADVETDETDAKYFTVSNGVLTTFDYTAAQADGVTEIVLPMSIKEIADEVFYNCTSLTKIEFYPTLKKIGEDAFCNCKGLAEMRLPDSVTEVGANMLSMNDENNAMRKLVLSNNITEIPGVFAECLALDEIYLPDSVTKVGNSAFGNSFTTSKIRLSSYLTEMGQSTFASTTVTSIIIPAGVKNIPYGAFMHCNNLKNIFICPGVETIGQYAFMGADDPKVIIPPTVTSIHADAFKPSLTTETCSPVIWGYKGTAAEAFANEEGYEFVDIDENTEGAHI